VPHKYKMTSKIMSAVFCFCVSQLAVSANNNGAGVSITPAEKNNNSVAIEGRIPGEKIDLHTGKVYHEVVDMVIPGNGGMDIKISRSYQKTSLPNYSVPHAMGNWEFSLPSITNNSGGVYGQNLLFTNAGCLRPNPGMMFIGYEGFLPHFTRRPWLGVDFNLPGHSARKFLAKKDSAPPEYGEFKWLTNDGYRATCISNVNNDYRTGYAVLAPDGKKYTFDNSISMVESSEYDADDGVYPR